MKRKNLTHLIFYLSSLSQKIKENIFPKEEHLKFQEGK